MTACMPSTYSFEPTPEWTKMAPRPFVPLCRPDEAPEKPPLPSPLRDELFSDGYIVSTHLVPAAFPRQTPDIPLPELSTNSLEKKNRQQLATNILELQELHLHGKLSREGSRKPLWNCINRYVKKVSNVTGNGNLTLFLVHGTGLNKELWEATLQYLLTSPAASSINEVWSWEAVQHGDAELVNEKNLSGIFDSQDNVRDIAHFLLHYLPEDAFSEGLPTHLCLLPEATSERRKTNGFLSRSLVAIGHSFGGCSLVLAAVRFPALFSSLVIIDPAITQRSDAFSDYLLKHMYASLARRDHWSSREEALHLFKSSPFGAWHPEVLRLYVTYGLCEDPQGGVKLKTSKLQEAFICMDARIVHEAWELLGELDDRIELRWIIPGKPTDKGIGGEQATRVRVWRRPANSSNVVIHSAGHLIVQEAPEELARKITVFLEKKYGMRSRAYL